MTNTTWKQKEVLISLTLTVSRISVEFEAGLAQAQERALTVDALSSDAHIILAAFIHVYDGQKVGKEKQTN